MPRFVVYSEEKKFMWDGTAYDARAQAEQVRSAYEKDGFETRLVEEEGKCLLYSRRVAAQQAAPEGG
jgi:hypothetical protein